MGYSSPSSSMELALRKRASGMLPSTVLSSNITFKVLQTLALSETKEVERIHIAPIHWVAIDSVENKYMLSCGADASIKLCDLDPSQSNSAMTTLIRPLAHSLPENGHRFAVSGVEWYPVDTGLFTSCSYDGTVRVWDTNTISDVCQFDLGSRVHSHAMSPTGAHTLIAAADESAYIRLCDMQTGSFAQSILACQGGSMTVAWSPTRPYIFASGGCVGEVKLWDIRRSDYEVHTFSRNSQTQTESKQLSLAHSGTVNALTFTECGTKLISAGHDQVIRLWNVEFPDDKPLVLSNNIQNQTPQAVLISQTALQNGSSKHTLLFFPNGDNNILVFDTVTGQQVSSLVGHMERPTCSAWRSKEMELYSGGYDCHLMIWCPTASEHLTDKQNDIRSDCWSDI